MNIHPGENIEEILLVVAETDVALIKLFVLPTSGQRKLLTTQIRSMLRMGRAETKEMIVLRRSLTVRCGGAKLIIVQSSCKFYNSFHLEERVLLVNITKNHGNYPSESKRDAVEDITPTILHR
ncbi:MAG: hypothetical protein ACI9RO_000964 [Alteromonas macleodii]|jgi:hypothetical protein